ncbi:hypothetical protein FW774_02060 (plasmid) [Pedobacter sp. BS3]|uniref:MSCRAMM family protein n=1 Tax=Pedobacter sp. BS3 TaxID=2567937 RepID=UPI0011EC0C51|nr:hypothetical protein [Pedobacter sp. BS3]TZF85878.1 hypothetical protein FW774_02060 [Pedobacter sp. BS3]
MKTRFILCIILIPAHSSFAQESKLWLSLGAGSSKTSEAAKTHLMGNGYNLQADAFVSLYRKGWDGSVKGSGFTLGVNISGNYTGIRNLPPDNAGAASRYQVYGGNVEVTSQSGGTMSGSFSGLIGIQARIALGKLNFSPSINSGYLQVKQKGYVQNGSVTMNGQTQQRDLVKTQPQNTNGFVVKPQVKIGYDFAPNFSFFLSPSIDIGPETKHTTYFLVPEGGFNDKNTYEPRQLARGTWESSTSTERYRIMKLNFGITMAIGKKRPAKPAGAASASYAAPGKLIKPQGVDNTNSPDSTNAASRISMNVTTPKRTQGKTFGEKVAQGIAANEGDNPLYKGNGTKGDNPLYDPAKRAMPGSPIGGIVVKGGKNPGGNNIMVISDSKGEILLNNLEAGNYLFQLSIPEQPVEKSINEKGVKRQDAVDGEKRTYTGGRKNEPQGKSINEKGVKRSQDASMARPGQPIGGIVVKGGKNPGGNFTNLTVNKNGQIGFEVLEAGDYKLILKAPDAGKPAVKSTKKSNGKGEKASTGLKDTLKSQV